ncbi:hypothetical protein ACI65C_004855 [Semiaphis heraclei]
MVRSHVELYDLSHAKYMDSGHKDCIWRSIGDEINLAEKDTLGNIEDVVGNEDNVDIFNDNINENENENENENDAVQIDENMDDIDGEQLQNVEQTQSSKPVRKSIQKRSIIKTPDSASTTLMKYIMQKKENNISNVTQNNPVDAFLAGLSPTLKTFTPYYLNLVKSKIFSIVQEYEMKMILDEEQKKHTVPYFTVPSPTYQKFIQNIIPNAAQNQYVQEPRNITSTSQYLSSPPSPQFSKKKCSKPCLCSSANKYNITKYIVLFICATIPCRFKLKYVFKRFSELSL